MTSILVKSQTRTLGPREFVDNKRRYRITAEVRYDDRCGNKHNTFAITGTIDRVNVYGGWSNDCCGCIHEEICKHFPELAPFIKWHGTSSDGPTHYVGNTMFWLGWQGFCKGEDKDPPNLEHARRAAVWPELPESFICPAPDSDWIRYAGGEQKTLWEGDKQIVIKALEGRLPASLEAFQHDVELLGFTF